MEQLTEEICRSCSSYTIKGVSLSVSVGYGIVNGSEESIVDCIKRSDSDMYQNKRRKKHRDEQ